MKTTKKTKAKKPEHVRLGTLPTTRSWKDVVGLVADGEGVEAVATRALTASGKAFVSIQNDAGFSEAVWVLTQLAVAAQAPEPHAHLEAIGLKLAAQSSVADVAACLHETLDRSLSKRRERSDFGEMAQSALVSAVSQHLNDKLGTLVAPTADDVHRSLAQLGRATEFGRLSRSFFARLAGDCMDYFLSKSLGAEVGAGRRFVTTAQMAEFEGAMATHAFEAAKIVEQFSGEWMSKHRFEGEGRIGRGEADRFGWYALEKVRAEMKARTPLATSEARVRELEAQNARLRGDLEYAEAERLRLTARRDTLDTQIAALTEKTTRLKEVLVDCHAYLMRRITLLTLNESASDTTQSLARDVSVALDALDDGKAAP